MYRIPLWLLYCLAVATQVALSRIRVSEVDFLFTVLVWIAITRKTTPAIFTGALLGITEDTLTGGFFGIKGFSMTLTGYLANIGGKILVSDSLAIRGLFLFVGMLFNDFLSAGLENLFTETSAPFSVLKILVSASATTVVGLGVFRLIASTEERLEKKFFS